MEFVFWQYPLMDGELGNENSVGLLIGSSAATPDDSVGAFSTAANFYIAIGGSETAAREMFPAPRP